MKRILCYGDSNTWGHDPNQIDSKTGLYCRYPESVRWTSVMQKELGADYFVREEGLCGRTTVFEDPTHYGWNGYQFFEVALRTCDPVDCVIFMLGTNDTKDLFNASPDIITMGMERLLRSCKDLLNSSNSYNARIILACPLKPVRSGDGSYWYDFSERSTEKIERMRTTYKELAERMGCEYFDVNTVSYADPADGIHLSTESHIALGKALAKEVQALFK